MDEVIEKLVDVVVSELLDNHPPPEVEKYFIEVLSEKFRAILMPDEVQQLRATQPDELLSDDYPVVKMPPKRTRKAILYIQEECCKRLD